MTYAHTRSAYSDLAGGDTSVHALISDEAFLEGILEFERALSVAAAKVGAIGEADCQAAVACIDGYRLDMAAIAGASAAGANPAIPIAKQLKAQAGDRAAGIHVGATSQDAIDTSLSLCLKRGGERLLELTGQAADLLRALAREHRDTPMMGRTLGQLATPTTFGAVAAGWLEGLELAAEELRLGVDKLPVQYGGATGTLAASHPHGLAIHDELAAGLNLAARPVVWHTNRVPFARVAAALALVAGACRKIAGDIVVLSMNEVGEVREAAPGGSSAMPHKANPAAAVAADGYARRAPALAATMLDAMDSRLERGVGSWHAEWPTLRELMATTASAVARTTASLDGLVVDGERMKEKLLDTGSTGHAGDVVDLILGKEA